MDQISHLTWGSSVCLRNWILKQFWKFVAEVKILWNYLFAIRWKRWIPNTYSINPIYIEIQGTFSQKLLTRFPWNWYHFFILPYWTAFVFHFKCKKQVFTTWKFVKTQLFDNLPAPFVTQVHTNIKKNTR